MLKYRKRQVISLSDQAMIAFGSHLVSNLNLQVKQQVKQRFLVKEIRGYLDNVGADSRVRQELLDLIASARPSAVQYNVRSICFAILLDPSISVFGSHLYWDICNRRIWKLMARQCANLRCLDLQNTLLPEDEIRYFGKILRNNTKLTELKLPSTVGKGEIRELIDKYCKNLRHLSIPDHDHIVIDAKFLSRSNVARTLTKIDFNISSNLEYAVHVKAIAKILQSCPNMEAFKNYAYVGSALRICQGVDSEFKCKLNMLHDTNTDQTIMETVVKTCPKLKRLHLTSPKSGSFAALANVVLDELIVEESFVCSELTEMLKQIGKHLFSLVLRGSSESLDICELRKNCPLLAKFEFEYLSNAQVDQMTDILEHLQELRIYKSLLSNSALSKLFYSAQNLRVLQIDKAHFDDAYMRSIITRCNFQNLKEFKIEVAPQLTVQTVKLLLDCCPNLQTLGSLGAWNLTPRDLECIESLQMADGPDLQLKINYVPHGSLLLLLK